MAENKQLKPSCMFCEVELDVVEVRWREVRIPPIEKPRRAHERTRKLRCPRCNFEETETKVFKDREDRSGLDGGGF